MMANMGTDDEFAEFDTSEDEFDQMWAEGEPVELGPPLGVPHTIATGPPRTFGVGPGSTIRPVSLQPAPTVQVAAAVSQR